MTEKSTVSRQADFPRYAWVVLFAIFVASVAAPINQFKVPPVMPALIADFGLTMTSAGMLMSVFSLAGLLIAFPAGAILSRLGQKATCALALGLIITGSVVGTYATQAEAMLCSRAVEGLGMAILGVTAPVVISSWFPPERRGVPMGIWSAWVSVGVIVMMNVSPLTTPEGQWVQTWWLGTGIAFGALLVFLVLHRMPQAIDSEDRQAGHDLKSMFKETFAIRDVWLISISLFSFNIMVLGMNTFFPTFLTKVQGVPMEQADFYSSLPNMAMLLSCPLGGWLADRTGSRKTLFSVCLGLLGVWWAIVFHVPVSLIPLMMFVFGMLGGPIISTIITALPDAVGRPALIGFGMSLLMFWHHLGEFVGPVYFGRVLDLTSSWPSAGLFMAPVCLVGAAAGMAMRIK